MTFFICLKKSSFVTWGGGAFVALTFFFSFGKVIALLFLEDNLISFLSLLIVSVFLIILSLFFLVEVLLKIEALLLVTLCLGDGSFFSSSLVSLIISDCCGIYFFDVLFLISKLLISL